MKKRFDDIFVCEDDDIVISFNVVDKNDTPVDATSAIVTFRLARGVSDRSLLELNNASGVSIPGSVVTISLNAGDIPHMTFIDNEILEYEAQLRITIGGKSMVSAFGIIHVSPLIA